MERMTVEGATPGHRWRGGAYPWELIQVVVSENIISMGLVRQI
jgi:hypothetical protein